MNPEVLENYVKAGKVAAQALEYGASLIKPGAIVRDVLDKIETFIKEQGAGIAFPAQTSINDVAAHFCPTMDDDRVFQDTDVVKLDVGAHVDGYVGDNAITINLDKDNEDKNKLVAASKAGRDAAIKLVKAGVTPRQLGKAIEQEIVKRGFSPIRNLSGHGLGQYEIHTTPSIPNYDGGDEKPLEAGQVIAIEPFATTGKGLIYNADSPTLFAMSGVKGVRSPLARQVLERIKTYNGLPFTTRWLEAEFGAKTKLALGQLKQADVIHAYPPLPEEGHGLVSQSEHTILVEKDGYRILTLP
ncbi:type II methionyl aminopeptidase [Candidatus Woesearchaeota archaeon]|nr:type II methionyl aminopeptidase [Candidatus Woesearchaeota archaeon]